MSYENPWQYKAKIIDSEILENYLGFVYIITNIKTGRQYIGKKLLKFTKRKKVKGKTKKILTESDWKKYYGSNKELLDDVEKIGYSNFRREILRLCSSKGECNYWEAKYQFEHGVLESDKYYNTWIMCKIHKKHVPKP